MRSVLSGLLILLRTDYEKGDHRNNWNPKQIDLWSRSIDLFKNEIDESMSNAQFAINYCISHKELSVTIPGMLNEKQVIENIKSSVHKKIPKKLLDNYHNIYKKTNFIIK